MRDKRYETAAITYLNRFSTVETAFKLLDDRT
jgi:hypothetical protein